MHRFMLKASVAVMGSTVLNLVIVTAAHAGTYTRHCPIR